VDYERIYYQLIENAKKNAKDHLGYFELHHIIPKSLGGSSRKDNLARLTGKQHFVAHRLLAKFTNGRAKCKMVLALHRFLHSRNYDFRITSGKYEYIKSQCSLAASILNKGKKFSDEARGNMSTAQKQRYEATPTHWRGRSHTENTKKKMRAVQGGENNPQFGKPRTEDEKRRISKKLEGRKLSPEQVLERCSRRMSVESRNKISQSIKEWHAKRKQDRLGQAVFGVGQVHLNLVKGQLN